MEDSIIIGLAQNIAILLSFSMMYDYFWSRNEKLFGMYFKLGAGIVLGGIGIVLILTPWHFVPGVFFDTRSVMLSIAGLFFGPIPTVTAMIITAAYRVSIGGAGALMGISVILSSGLIGLFWRQFRPSWRKKNRTLELGAMGLLVHLAMLCCTLLLPGDIKWKTLSNIALPVIVIYPSATVLLGSLMLNQAENWKTRKALKISEERWHFALEGAGDGVWDWNPQTNKVYFSKQWKLMLGYEEDEIENKLEEWDKRVHPNDKEMVYKALNQYMAGKIPAYAVEHRLLCKDGSYKWIHDRGKIMVRDKDGKPLRFLGTHTDISEWKTVQEEVKKIGKHYQALIEKAPDGIVLIGIEGNFKYISPSARKMFGYSPTEDITGHPDEFTHPDDLPLVLSLLDNLIQDPSQVPTLQYRFRDKDGQWKWVESTFSNLLFDSSVEAIVINFRDITDRKLADEEISKLNQELEQKVIDRTNELEKRSRELIDNEAALLNLVEDLNLKSEELQRSTAQLEVTNKELEAFSYSVSHDLRAPLRAISGFVSILMEDYEKVLDAEGKRICNIIHSNAIKMGQLIDDLLSFSRLIRSELHHSKVNMDSLVKGVISDFETNHDLSKKKLIVQDLPESFGDANLLKQVWTNLISNAIKYSSKNENAQITIGSYPEKNEVVYYITDNGVGFDMEYVHKLFGVFHRLHSVNEFEGTGVGLAIVQRIINRHQGRVWAEGEIGKGASFYFSLPGNPQSNHLGFPEISIQN